MVRSSATSFAAPNPIPAATPFEDDPIDFTPPAPEPSAEDRAWWRAREAESDPIARVCAELLLRVSKLERDLTAVDRGMTDRGLADARMMAAVMFRLDRLERVWR